MIKTSIKVVTIGSCMSEGILAALQNSKPDIKFQHLNHVIHNRSDYFLNCFIDKIWEPVNSNKIIDNIDVYNSPEFPNINLLEENKFYLDNQSYEKLGVNRIEKRKSLIKNMLSESIDIFIVDNFMDIAAMLVSEKTSVQKYFLISGAFSAEKFNSIYNWSGYLSPEESFVNWTKIVNWLKEKQPSAKIFFAPFPVKVYGHETKPSIQRAADFRRILLQKDFPANILDICNADACHIANPTDWSHYTQSYYLHAANSLEI